MAISDFHWLNSVSDLNLKSDFVLSATSGSFISGSRGSLGSLFSPEFKIKAGPKVKMSD